MAGYFSIPEDEGQPEKPPPPPGPLTPKDEPTAKVYRWRLPSTWSCDILTKKVNPKDAVLGCQMGKTMDDAEIWKDAKEQSVQWTTAEPASGFPGQAHYGGPENMGYGMEFAPGPPAYNGYGAGAQGYPYGL